MNYVQLIHDAAADPLQLEEAYQAARQVRADGGFAAAVHEAYAEQPDNLLYAAWHYRLAYETRAAVTRTIPWLFAVLLAGANGVLLWLLSDTDQLMLRVQGRDTLPLFMLLWGPLAGLFVLAYLARTGALSWRWWGGLAAGVAAVSAYAGMAYLLMSDPAFQEQYQVLAALHLPVLAWALVGIGVLHGLGDSAERFSFLLKSLELFILGGLFVAALGVLTLTTFALFSALGLDLPLLAQRLLIAGGAGMIPVLAVAIAYDPARAPAQQPFEGGLSKLLALLLRLFLPLTLAVLVVYLCFVPFYFWRPFENRDVLITYNAMLFAVMALLLGVTPASVGGMGAAQERWLRRGIVAVAALAAVVSLYALAAISYRTVQEGLTPNRVTFIGWNIINTGLLLYLVFGQVTARGAAGAGGWLAPLHRAFGAGALLYAGWSLAVLAGLPWLF
jgi:hypothetical protein